MDSVTFEFRRSYNSFDLLVELLNSSAAVKSALSTTVAPAELSVFSVDPKEARICAGALLLKQFRGTPIVIPPRSVPLQKVVKSGIGSNGICQVLSSKSLRPAMLLSMYAASLTVLVRVPMTSCRFEIGIAPSVPMSPRVGLNPTTLLSSAGSKMLPKRLAIMSVSIFK
jgi:hypothetical protein